MDETDRFEAEQAAAIRDLMATHTKEIIEICAKIADKWYFGQQGATHIRALVPSSPEHSDVH